jgi:hypothetical protein
MEKLRGREYFIGVMGKSTMENGSMESKKAMGSGRERMEIHTLGSGKTQRRMGMECILGKMVIDMKESGWLV